jgi:CheY-like chemotaxis protein
VESDDLARILFIDDEPHLLDGVTRTLRRKFSLVTAVGPEAGLAAAETQGPFAVIIADMRMPGMDGLTLLSKIRSMAPATVRLLLTGDAEAGDAVSAVARGIVSRCIAKPCPPNVLLSVLQEAVAKYRAAPPA